MLRITMGGVQILGRPLDLSPRVEGLFVGPDGFEGWDDGTEARRETIERVADHGDFDVPTFQGSRVFSIDGHAFAWSERELAHLRHRVIGVGADGGRLKVTVEHQGQELWVWARRGGKPIFKDAGIRSGMLRGTFLVQMVAADPRKYGEVRDFPAGSAAIHYGNFPATPRLMVGAGSGGYTVTGPGGRVITVNSNAPAEAHSIDFVTGGLFNGAGGRVPNAITVYQPWSIPVGLPGVTATITGSRSLAQRVTETYI
ncbi:hypothetical protein AB0E56_13030 [Microbacterium sp. NPDC028030]|uniref:hypothetical protein n=1 Tax=Microbacterium sp. NPDC028030 TaxID=3155124 RepID=UPI00340DB0AA